MLQTQRDENGQPITDKKGRMKADKELTDTEQVPLLCPGGIKAFMEKEVLLFAPDA